MNSIRKLCVAAVAIMFVTGCSSGSGPDAVAGDVFADAASDIAQDFLVDGGLEESVEDEGRDTGFDTPDDRDAAEDTALDISDDRGETTDDGNEADGETVDTFDRCGHCPRSICDPETLECLDCIRDIDCGLDGWCDEGTCRDHICAPGANFCNGTALYRCSENGAGFTIIKECADTDPCTVGDGCENGRCVPGTEVVCTDDNQCTIDYCGAAGTCEHYPATGIACDDGNQCTLNDLCSSGECRPGTGANCTDSNPCTLDYCTSILGCVHEPVAGECVDSNGCTTDDRCIEGRCGGDARDCDDHDQCTTDYCLQGSCRHDTVFGCQPCTADDQCPAAGPCEIGACDIASGTCITLIKRTDGCCVTVSDCPETPPCARPICDVDHRCGLGALAQTGCCEPLVWTESFDTGLDQGWTITAAAPESGWRIGTATGNIDGMSGPALYFGNESETTYGSEYSASGTATTPWFTVPAASAATLSLDLWMDVDPTGGYDELQIFVLARSSMGLTKRLLWNGSAAVPQQQTTGLDIDVSAYSGRQVALEFAFDTFDEISNDGRGIYIDSLSVTASCTGLGCLIDDHCKSAGLNGFCRDSRCDFSRSWMPSFQFGEPGGQAGQFNSPTDLAVVPGPEGTGTRIVVVDSRTHYIQVFEPDGAFVRMFGGYGSAGGKFLSPRGVADSEGRIYIADSGNNRIQVMTPSGVLLYRFGTSGTGPGQMDTPRDVAVSADGNLVYVADTGNHRISVYSRLGSYLYSFGGYGRTPGRFRTPSAIAQTPDGRIWVADTQNNRVQVFSADGILKKVIAPTGDHALDYPGGVAALPGSGVVVADTYNHRLVFMDSEGRVTNTLGSFGTGPEQFNYPSDVDVNGDGPEYRLTIADAGNSRVSVWTVRAW